MDTDCAPHAAAEDWETRLHAVKAKLRQTMDGSLAAANSGGGHGALGQFQGGVLECLEALDQLHAALAHELRRFKHLELEFGDTQNALAQARHALMDTQAEEKNARYLALHDSLTSLPNRRYFRESLDAALLQLAPQSDALALLYIDIDDFKLINDSHGHHAGDELLKIVAARLVRSMRAEDFVARLGGDEFACILQGQLGREDVARLADKLFDAVSAPFKIGDIKLSVRPSIGIALCPVEGMSAERLLQHADAAMYRAKQEQTGHAFFAPRAEPQWPLAEPWEAAAGR